VSRFGGGVNHAVSAGVAKKLGAGLGGVKVVWKSFCFRSRSGAMAEVFISYKSERRSAAQHLARVIELYGYSAWFDYWLISGKDFGRQIERELNEAKAVVVLWCPLSRESEWVLEEAHFAQRHGKLTPAWLERVDPPLGFGRADTIDLTDWNGAPRGGHGFDRLLDEIARLVGREPRMPGWKPLRDYEATWRNFGAPRLAQFPLINPLHEREEARDLDEKARREEEERIAAERRKAEEAEARRVEAEQRAAAEAEDRRLQEERRKAEEAETRRTEDERRKAAEAEGIEQERREAAEAMRREQEQRAAREWADVVSAPVAPKSKAGLLAALALVAAVALAGGWFAFAPAPRPPQKVEQAQSDGKAPQAEFNSATQSDTISTHDAPSARPHSATSSNTTNREGDGRSATERADSPPEKGELLARQSPLSSPITPSSSSPASSSAPQADFDVATHGETYSIKFDISSGVLNMRSGPGPRHSIVVAIPAGANGIRLGACMNPDDGINRHPWCHARWGDYSGWVSREFLVGTKEAPRKRQ
jgi:hypothetical protein